MHAEMNSLCLVLTEVLVDVAEEHHDEADGEEVDGEERRQRPARQPPRAQQLPHGVVVVVVDICEIFRFKSKVHRYCQSNVPSFEFACIAMNGISYAFEPCPIFHQ